MIHHKKGCFALEEGKDVIIDWAYLLETSFGFIFTFK